MRSIVQSAERHVKRELGWHCLSPATDLRVVLAEAQLKSKCSIKKRATE
jgi:hypothetical protein